MSWRNEIEEIHCCRKLAEVCGGPEPSPSNTRGESLPCESAFGLSVFLPHIKSGKLRALGVTSAQRASIAPDIPAVAETVPGYEFDAWFGVFGPGGVPASLAQRLQKQIARILHSPDLKEQLASLGAEPIGSTPEHFAAHVRAEVRKYAGIVKTANIRVE